MEREQRQKEPVERYRRAKPHGGARCRQVVLGETLPRRFQASDADKPLPCSHVLWQGPWEFDLSVPHEPRTPHHRFSVCMAAKLLFHEVLWCHLALIRCEHITYLWRQSKSFFFSHLPSELSGITWGQSIYKQNEYRPWNFIRSLCWWPKY